jgi:hypothetical protein
VSSSGSWRGGYSVDARAGKRRNVQVRGFKEDLRHISELTVLKAGREKRLERLGAGARIRRVGRDQSAGSDRGGRSSEVALPQAGLAEDDSLGENVAVLVRAGVAAGDDRRAGRRSDKGHLREDHHAAPAVAAVVPHLPGVGGADIEPQPGGQPLRELLGVPLGKVRAVDIQPAQIRRQMGRFYAADQVHAGNEHPQKRRHQQHRQQRELHDLGAPLPAPPPHHRMRLPPFVCQGRHIPPRVYRGKFDALVPIGNPPMMLAEYSDSWSGVLVEE